MCNYLFFRQSSLKSIAVTLAVRYTEIMGTNFPCRKTENIFAAREELFFLKGKIL